MRNARSLLWLAAVSLLAFGGCNKGATQSAGNSASPNSNAPASAQPSGPAPPVTIPAGKVLTVTLDQSVGTKINNDGDRFDASLAAPVTVDATEVLPSGTRAVGTVVRAQEAGKVKGGAVLALTLDSITVNGQKYSIETTEFEDVGKGRGKRSLIGGGGGAAFGAIVGALAGGGKGAAIGAMAGGGAGTAGAAFTGKRDITLPAETRLHFKLEKQITIAGQ
jgi:hypothetical protein